jgi:hexosaminidase
VLVDVVEPVKDYNRWKDEQGPINFHAPLTRMIDAAYPESETAREFGALVQKYIQSGYKDQAAEAQIRSWLTLWRDNDAKLHPLLTQSFLLEKDVALSQNLSMVAAAGLQALDYLGKSQPEPDLWRAQQIAVLELAKQPSDDVLLMIVAPVQQLVEASGQK